MSDTATSASSHLEQRAIRKITWRLIPFLMLLYFVAFLDRINVGFAALTMNKDVGLTSQMFGLGAGIFFLGYFAFEVPSTVILHNVGARFWIGRVMITWGLVSVAMAFTRGPISFYVLRFLLGLAEAGFFPGIILYLTYWYPAERRGRITTFFMTAIALSGVIGGPISGFILKRLDGLNGWHGWQWLFLLEGLPSIVVGVIVFIVLDDRIANAKWLSGDERQLLEAKIRAEDAQKEDPPLRQIFTSARVWQMSVIYFSFVMGLYGVSFWLPTIIKRAGVADPLAIGLLSAIPFGAAVIAMILVARSADKRRERRWHVALPGLAGALGLVLSVSWAHDVTLAMIALTLATMGIMTTLPLFWSLPTAMLAGTGAAAGIAMINSVGNLAGFVSPYLVGWLKDLTASTDSGMYMLAAFLVLGAVIALSVPKRLVAK
jgi:D-galactonate transporter